MEQFTTLELGVTQIALDLYPDASGFWDSEDGQETLRIAKLAGLKPTNTDRERCARYAQIG